MTRPMTPDPLAVTLRKRGIKNSANSSRATQYVGRDAKRSFRDSAIELASQFTVNSTDVAKIGQHYDNAVYQKTAGSKERDYEDVYADVDWTTVAEDPIAKQTLADAFGDNANDSSGSKVDVAALRTVLGKQKTVSAVNGLGEVRLGLTSVQDGTSTQQDEDTRGIRSVDDVDAPIETTA